MKTFKPLLIAALALLCSTAANAHDFEVNGIYYSITNASNKTVAVTYRGTSINDYSNEYIGSVVIPTTVKYNNVTYSVTSIGRYAFYDCDGLTSVTIPNSVTSIGDDAFDVCTGLTSVTIPNSVTSIGDDAFHRCTGLESIVVQNGNSVYDSRSNCNAIIETATNALIAGCKNTVIPSNVTSIGNSAFSGCTGLTSIEIPNSVTSIWDDAFYGCTGLTSITIPNSVTSIGDEAFRGCTGLTSITIPNSVTSIGYDAFNRTRWYENQPDGVVYAGRVLYTYKGEMPENTRIMIKEGTLYITASAFSGCSGLTNITIPNSVTSIGYGAFKGCSGLTSIEIPNSVTSIGDYAFDACTSLKELYIEDGEGTLSLGYNNYSTSSNGGEGLFYDCPLKTLYLGRNLSYNEGFYYGYSPFCNIETLTSVTIGNSVTSIGGLAFNGCTGLTSVTIPNSVTSIGDNAFKGCSGITSIEIPNSVTSIENYAFRGCTGLASIIIGKNVTSIGDYAFDACTSLKELYIEDGEGTLSLGYNYPSSNDGEGLFYDCPLKTLYLGRNLSYNEDFYYGYSPFCNIETLTSVTIGNSVTSIGQHAFRGCSGLKEVHISDLSAWCGINFEGYSSNPLYSAHNLYLNGELVTDLVIPDGISEIKNHAFSGCSGFTSIEIPNSVTSIGDRALNGCSGLTSVTIPNSVTSIGSSAFSGCSGITSIEIPNSVTSIGSSAFSGCSGITSIEIPNSLTSIGNGAFNGCIGLKKIELNCATIGSWFRGISSIEEVVIGNSVTSIGNSAFSGCTGLASIEIPNSVTSIGWEAFDACTSLKELYIEDGEGTLSLGYNYHSSNVGEGLFYDCPLETLYLGRNLSYNEDSDYGYSPFYNIKTLKSVTIGNSVTSIGNSAFYDCDGLTSVTIGNGVTNIGDSAFSGCDIKKAIWLTNTPPAGYKNIGATINYVANDQYSGLRNVKVYPFLSSLFEADGVKYVPVSPAERTCDVIDCLHDSVAVEIVVKNTIIYKGISMNVKEIMPYAFYGNNYIHNIELNNDGSIGDGAFLGCSNLYYVKISNKGSIGSGSFGNCSGLIAVILEDSVSSIGASAFYGCSSLKDVSIGNGVKSIGNWAFSGCSSLDYFAFGRSVQSIGEEAFSDCNNITQIYTNATVPPVCGAQALDDINKWNCTLYVPSESKTAYQQAEQWKEFFFVNDLPTAINGVVQDKEEMQPIYYDLNGRVVENPSKGIYIINGKKVYIK